MKFAENNGVHEYNQIKLHWRIEEEEKLFASVFKQPAGKSIHCRDSMGGKWGVGKKEMCHRPHGVLITITKHGEQKKLVIGHEKPPTTPT